jgi:hypothetical protein
MAIELIRIRDISIDRGLQARVATRQDVVDDYATLLAEGVRLPPPRACRDDAGAIWLWDGHHTVGAHARHADRQGDQDAYEIEVDVEAGSRSSGPRS